MKLFAKWIDSVVYPERYQMWAAVVSLGLLVALSHWHAYWLPAHVHDWLTSQRTLPKAAIYSAACTVVFLVTSFVMFCVVEAIKRSTSSE